MINKAKKYLEDRNINDIKIKSNSKNFDFGFDFDYSLSELMSDFANQEKGKFERSKFTIDVRKPQFIWFLVFVLFSFLGIIITFIKLIKLLF